MALTANLTTVVRNISGRTITIGCLPRSKRMSPGQEVTISGDLVAALKGNKRKLDALQRALHVDKVIAIVSSPNVHLYDDTRDVTKVLRLDNGSLSTTDPSWGTYSSSLDQGQVIT